MTPFVLRHLLESTLFCLLLSLLACCLRNTATANVRHAVWLIGISKFAIPSVLLAKTGAAIAFLWPAASWLSSLARRLDNLIGILVHGLVCVFWFHPLLWLVERQRSGHQRSL
jgi:beta-lactamase regulating signal transducer with metallopeptidase domain